MEKREPDYNNDINKMVVSNTFIKAHHPEHMSLSAMKLLRMTITQCRMEDKQFYEVEYKLSDVAKLFHTQPQHVYRDVVEASIKMLQSVIAVNDRWGNVRQIYTLFKKWEYVKKTETIKVLLNDEVAPLFLELKKNFTRVPIAAILTMRSKYAIRLYEAMHERMLSASPHGLVAVEVSFTLDEIRKITGTDDKKAYSKISNLRDRIILPAVEDIEDYGEWKIIVKDAKEGRRITGFIFEVWSYSSYQYIESCKNNGVFPGDPQTSVFDWVNNHETEKAQFMAEYQQKIE